MNIAVVGNREGWTEKEVEDVLRPYFDASKDMLITGGADGVDNFAFLFAKKNKISYLVIYPDMKIKSPDRYFQRNKKIVERCDMLIAFNKKKRSGTKNSINIAERLGKDVTIIGENKTTVIASG